MGTNAYGFHLQVESRRKHAECEFAVCKKGRGGVKTFDAIEILMPYRVNGRKSRAFSPDNSDSDHAELSITKDRTVRRLYRVGESYGVIKKLGPIQTAKRCHAVILIDQSTSGRM